MTPQEVRSLRQQRSFPLGDLYGAVGAADLVAARESQVAKIEEQCADIRKWLGILPSEIASHYGWAVDPDSYNLASEASWQRRLITMLTFWAKTVSEKELRGKVENIVVVQSFITKFGLVTPRTSVVREGQTGVIDVPSGFLEFALWMYVGFRCWCARDTDSWQTLAEKGWAVIRGPVIGERDFPTNHVTTLEMLARVLAEEARDQDLYGPNIALAIREKVPYFAGPTGDLDANGLLPIERDMAYMLMEFVLAHELGHVISGHHQSPENTAGSKTEHAAARYMSRETEADLTGLRLLELTAPTRNLPLTEQATTNTIQALFGLILFEIFLRCHLSLITLVQDHSTRLLARTGGGRRQDWLTEEQWRLKSTENNLRQISNAVGTTDPIGRQFVDVVQSNGIAYATHLATSIEKLPDQDFIAAMGIARKHAIL